MARAIKERNSGWVLNLSEWQFKQPQVLLAALLCWPALPWSTTAANNITALPTFQSSLYTLTRSLCKSASLCFLLSFYRKAASRERLRCPKTIPLPRGYQSGLHSPTAQPLFQSAFREGPPPLLFQTFQWLLNPTDSQRGQHAQHAEAGKQ